MFVCLLINNCLYFLSFLLICNNNAVMHGCKLIIILEGLISEYQKLRRPGPHRRYNVSKSGRREQCHYFEKIKRRKQFDGEHAPIV